jgi:hypothetical protein
MDPSSNKALTILALLFGGAAFAFLIHRYKRAEETEIDNEREAKVKMVV